LHVNIYEIGISKKIASCWAEEWGANMVGIACRHEILASFLELSVHIPSVWFASMVQHTVNLESSP
jgi:hypothetical protein